MNRELPEFDDYLRIFLEDIPLLDVRAPVEFGNGALPMAENHPLVDDDQRHLIGLEYKAHGPDAALALGKRLVKGNLRETRTAAWRAFAERHPNAVLYCFRGGMRSRISQYWLYERNGVLLPRVRGGYKALRRFLIDELHSAATLLNYLVIGGRTGVGKTLLLRRLPGSLDLEDLAWHRGSAFGRHATPQPTQINFENALAIRLLKHHHQGNAALIVEDESKHVGSRHVPRALYDRLKASPLVILEASLEQRIENTFNEYIVEALAEYRAQFAEAGTARWAADLQASLARIKRRLGLLRYQDLHNTMRRAIAEQQRSGKLGLHRMWIRALLAEYYDPMYDYQLAKNSNRIRFSGAANAVEDYVRHALSCMATH
jgi:tRNA 2-selenouridine synthase